MNRSASRLVIALAIVLAAVGILSPALQAHPTANSYVEIRFADNGVVNVIVTTDEKALLLKLDALDTPSRRPSDLDSRSRRPLGRRTLDDFPELSPLLLDQILLSSDSAPVPLTFQNVAEVTNRPGLIAVRLAGTIPATAQTLTWKTSLFMGSYPLSVRRGTTPAAADQSDDYEWLNGQSSSRPYALHGVGDAGSRWARLGGLIATGFTHIIPAGLDHMLFVLGLFLLARGTRALLFQITAFTLAHSATLALAATGLVSIPASVVEPLIAISIVYVAVENVLTTRLSRWRLAVVFAFGLLHGLGFAGALADLGIDRTHLAETLVGFNVGVELGQLTVVAAAALVLRALPVQIERRRAWITVPGSLAIAVIGAYWAVERLVT